MQNFVNKIEVNRFNTYYEYLHPLVQERFKKLFQQYQQWPVYYDQYSTFTEFNIRYKSHPQTNLSEALAMDLLISRGCCNVKLLCDQPDQTLGGDLSYGWEGKEVIMIQSVKLCIINRNDLSIANTIKNALCEKDKSDEICFVDNINQRALIVDRKSLLPILKNAQSSTYNRFRIRLSFNDLPPYSLLSTAGPFRKIWHMYHQQKPSCA